MSRARHAVGAALGLVWGIIVLAVAAAVVFLLLGWRGIDY